MIPQFETSRLILRGVTLADIPAYKKYFEDYAIISQLSAAVPWPYPESGVDLWRVGVPEHRGFWLGKPFWGQGIMTEAVEPVMDYAFTSLGFETLVFSNALGNTKSRRVKEKTGARLIGTRPAKFVEPSYTEAETWELTKDEWFAHKA